MTDKLQPPKAPAAIDAACSKRAPHVRTMVLSGSSWAAVRARARQTFGAQDWLARIRRMLIVHEQVEAE